MKIWCVHLDSASSLQQQAQYSPILWTCHFLSPLKWSSEYVNVCIIIVKALNRPLNWLRMFLHGLCFFHIACVNRWRWIIPYLRLADSYVFSDHLDLANPISYITKGCIQSRWLMFISYINIYTGKVTRIQSRVIQLLKSTFYDRPNRNY